MHLRDELDQAGFVGPIRVFDPAECGEIRRRLREAPSPVEWFKGNVVGSPEFLEIARHPAIVDPVAELIGDDLMVWGAGLLERKPNQVHAWHTDIETSRNDGGTVTVWIGLENTSRDSALRMVSRSHRFGTPIQERAAHAGKTRQTIRDDDVVAWARELDAGAEIIQPAVGDGEAVFFDGRLWHGSHNTRQLGTRTALLLQYARPDVPIRIPDFSQLDYPFRFLEEPWPPCVMVRGSGRGSNNYIVPGPTSRTSVGSRSWFGPLDLPLEAEGQDGWRRHPLRAGPTATMTRMTCHASVLDPGKTPHEPHAHAEEEILLVLDGEASLVIVDDRGEARREAARPGSLVYYPAGQRHTIHNSGSGPVTYLMFKWRGEEQAEAEPLGTQVIRYQPPPLPTDANGRPWTTSLLFQGPTRYLRKLHSHVSSLVPGGGYEPHVDAYDVALVVLRGTIETLGQRVHPHGVVFYAAGEPHGLRNVGDEPAAYLVFEFHGQASEAPRTLWLRIRSRLPRGVRGFVPRPLVRLAKKALGG